MRIVIKKEPGKIFSTLKFCYIVAKVSALIYLTHCIENFNNTSGFLYRPHNSFMTELLTRLHYFFEINGKIFFENQHSISRKNFYTSHLIILFLHFLICLNLKLKRFTFLALLVLKYLFSKNLKAAL